MDNDQRVSELTSENTGFRREISLFGGISIIGGIMVGSGIFYLGSYVLMRSGMSQGLALLCWIIGGVVSLLGGLCYAELGTSIPKAGGGVVYLSEAYHPIVGFLSGFNSWVIGGPGSISALAIALPTALAPYLGYGDMGIKVFATVLIIGLTIYNFFGVKGGSRLQNVTMVAKLLPIFLIIAVALFAGKATPDLSLSVKHAETVASANPISMIAFSVIATLWAYEGWTNLNTVTEEIKNPKRNLPLSLIIAIGGVTVLYTVFNFSIYRVLDADTIYSEISAGNYFLGTVVARQTLGAAGAIIVIVTMVISMFGSLNGCILAFPRAYYAMAKGGHFFPSFGRLHPKYRIPHVALMVQAVISLVLVWISSLNQLTNLVEFGGCLFNFLIVLSVLILRKKYPSIERPYKVWGGVVTVVITAFLFLGLVVNTFIDDPKSAIIGMAVPAVGFVMYFILGKYNEKHPFTEESDEQ
ncbi:MAG: amino acid permease [Firmicutes bacterium]|nr:amino acid permease [Bacillota bacterium]